MQAILRDVTERKEIEKALSHSYELMQYVIENANSAVAVHDRDLKYIYVSQNYLDQYKIKDKNMWAVLLAGMASGLIVGRCTAPILGALLFYVGSQQNVVYGASLMFVFSYGVGASLILIGTFSGILASLPKSGTWLLRIKQFCGFVLIIAAQYFLIKAGGLLI